MLILSFFEDSLNSLLDWIDGLPWKRAYFGWAICVVLNLGLIVWVSEGSLKRYVVTTGISIIGWIGALFYRRGIREQSRT